MNLKNFRPIYRQLADVTTKEYALFIIRENITKALPQLKRELDLEPSTEIKKTIIPIYNNLIAEHYPFFLHSLGTQEYQPLDSLFAHYTSYFFEKDSYSTHLELEKLMNHWIQRLDKQILESKNGIRILREINTYITKSFVLDQQFLGHYDYTEISRQHIVSQYTLAILYLIVAERLCLPIYGIPFKDKLVLCYAQEYCTDSELVFEDDIKNYIVVGEKDIIYTPLDLELYAMLLETKIDLKNKLPRNNHEIIQAWTSHLVHAPFDITIQSYLSSKYQQIEEFVRDFDHI